ncbi:hypothetical protein HHE06_11050 [Helicobacter heilmannii]|uniref:Uncharacterized protein n=1 Tax=Helicobacter heilmannii TaxID=35817 RepID=A0A0K2XVS6_HELHE|nr:hypothetical protein BN341_10050 [Helicobacter heilmannii ASB1.4]CRF45156.1 hypothetical protein HHE014_01080 [Helicobacter heilmannii]CRF51241.1 hypothetical protein HHE06_11050 [Helicobacter heilmannii]CRI34647.1 hypothetical protein HHE01_04480 [Helicobacter heilmannii]
MKEGDFVVLVQPQATWPVYAPVCQNFRSNHHRPHTHAKGDILFDRGADFVLATQEDDLSSCLNEITRG